MNTLLTIAFSQYGVTEWVGSRHNPAIIRYSREIGYKGIIKDETAWCSIFINWCALKADLPRSGELDARSWLTVGTPTGVPRLGDLVIFWRESPSSWKGHVGIYINHSENRQFIYCLGGNQNNQVNIKPYPVTQLLGFRRLQPASKNTTHEKD